MSIEDKILGKQEATPAPIIEAPVVKVEETKKQTLEEVITLSGQEDPTDEKKKTDPKDGVIVSLKKELRENKRDMGELKSLVTDLANVIKSEKQAKMSDAKIQAFAEKRGVDPESIRDLAELLRDEVVQPQATKVAPVGKQSKDEVDEDDEDDEEEVPEVTKKFNKTRLGQAVDKMVSDFLTDIPEYANIVDVDTVKEMILANPQAYANKTISEIVDKIYGKAIKGKGGIEAIKSQNRDTTKKTTGKLSQADMENLKTDPQGMKDYKADLLSRATKFGLN